MILKMFAIIINMIIILESIIDMIKIFEEVIRMNYWCNHTPQTN